MSSRTGRWFGDRATVTQQVTVAAGVWTDWVTVATPTNLRDVVGMSWNVGIGSGTRRLQFAVGDAGFEVLVGPELRSTAAGVTQDALQSMPFPLFTTVPDVRLAARFMSDSSAGLTNLTVTVFFAPVSRP